MRLNWEYETCACCTREQRLSWGVHNSLWERVVIEYYKNKVLCLECFLRIADDKNIHIDIDDITFYGLI